MLTVYEIMIYLLDVIIINFIDFNLRYCVIKVNMSGSRLKANGTSLRESEYESLFKSNTD